MGQGLVLRLFGCAIASFFAFVVCMLIGSEFARPFLGRESASGWEVLVSLAVATAFGWAFWAWPKRKP
jgi:O-antigen/teichoic acid export membrane protein